MKTLSAFPASVRRLLFSLALSAVTVMGCDVAATDPTPLPAAAEADPGDNRGAADAPVRTAYLRIGKDPTPRAVQYSEVDGLAVFEGDIILGRASELPSRPSDVSAQAVAIVGRQWHDGVVPYTIASSLPEPERVTEAIRHWERKTSIRFVPRTAQNAAQYPDFVTFQPGNDNCTSHVGRVGGQQFIDLVRGCDTGSTIHEIGHLLGLWHEQSREDRDNFVRILWENIQPGREHAFFQHISDGDDLGSYDYGSIMHYGPFVFSRNGLPTILAPQPIGQNTELSRGDIQAIERRYPILLKQSSWNPQKGWTVDGALPLSIVGRPAVAPTGYLYGRGPNDTLMQTHWVEGWGWEVISIPEVSMVGNPAVVTKPEWNQVFLYSRDASGHLQQTSWAPDTGWVSFSIPEVPMVNDPAVVAKPEWGQVFLYSRDAAGFLQQTSWAPDTGWVSFSIPEVRLLGEPAVVAKPEWNQVFLYSRGLFGFLQQTSWAPDTGWVSFLIPEVRLSSDPVATTSPDKSQVFLYSRDASGHLQQTSWAPDTGWVSFSIPEVPLRSDPAALPHANGVFIFAR